MVELRAELAEVVVEVFIHAPAPGLRRKCPEKRVGMRRASCVAAGVELADFVFEPRLFSGKFAGIGDDQVGVGRIVAREWLFVRVDRLDEWADQAADQQARQNQAAGGQVERGGTMGEHLGDIHFAPLALSGGLKRVDAGQDFVDGFGLEEIFHRHR